MKINFWFFYKERKYKQYGLLYFYDDHRRLQESLIKKDASALILAEDIVFKKGTNPNLDIFDFSGESSGMLFMVSERLKQRLEQEKITGITFEEYPYTISIDE